MKLNKFFALLLVFVLIFAVGCSGSKISDNDKTATDKPTESQTPDKPDETQAGGKEIPEEGKDTNNGRPYNLTPVKYDSRDDKYLNGINATILPVTDEPVTVVVWQTHSSTVIQDLNESEVYKELAKRTGVNIEFVHPPAGQENDNFSLRVATLDLPHIFANPPAYAGGYQKAVEDGIYIELTEYYDRGLMPNIKWLRENNDDINKDIVDDEGRMYFFPMIDIVPTDPWTGLWVRGDWVEELGLELPTTIEDWDIMLRAMKDAKNIAPLGLDILNWYGISYNYSFLGSFETGYDFINKDGIVEYGPINAGYKDFLTLMHKWYEDGLIDPDFATRDFDSFLANLANGKYGAVPMGYGQLGQTKLSGLQQDPNWKLTPVLQPTSYPGQVIHLHQDNTRVRENRRFFTTRLVDDGIVDTIVKWQDYWYSQDGGDLLSYGPEGVSYQWKEDGTIEWIYPRLNNDEGLDFWTIFPLFKIHTDAYLRDSSAYTFEPEVLQAIELWDSQDSSWLMPDNMSHTAEENSELSTITTEINTYRDEMVLKFIMGMEPLDKFDDYVATIKNMNIDRAIEIKQKALDRYNNRK